jgi:hypothetical protein
MIMDCLIPDLQYKYTQLIQPKRYKYATSQINAVHSRPGRCSQKPQSGTGGVDPGLNPQTPKVSLAGMPDNGPKAAACGGDIMRVRHFN